MAVRILLLCAVMALASCRRPAPAVSDAGAPAAQARAPAVEAIDAGVFQPTDAGVAAPLRVALPPPEPEVWTGPLSAADLRALDDYRAFSADGLLFASVDFSTGAGVHVLSFRATTTGTVEKTVALASERVRREELEELREEGFPRPGRVPRVPSNLAAVARDGTVFVTFSGMPAARPWRPFPAVGGAAGAPLESVAVVAVSRDGKHAAVRAVSGPHTEFGRMVDYHVAALFEE